MPEKNKTKSSPSYGVRGVEKWNFDFQELPEAWLKHLGDIPSRFLMYVDGDGGHGKTEYIMQASKMFAMHMGKVKINNVEQGKHVQIKQSLIRNNMSEIQPGKWLYKSIHSFEAYKKELSRHNSGRIQIIDSISYFPLSTGQVQELIESYPKKSFIFVAYKAHFNQNKPIAHLCDIKVRVERFIATPSGRFGGNEPYIIWDKKKPAQLPLEYQPAN